MSFPKRGKFFPEKPAATVGAAGRTATELSVAEEIASVLRGELGSSRAAVKTLTNWTGANERTVKNWMAGRYGPSGPHLIMLMGRSDAVLALVLDLADRRDCDAAVISRIECHLYAATTLLRRRSGRE